MWGGDSTRAAPVVVPALSLLLGLSLGPAHSGLERRRHTGLPQPQGWKAGRLGSPRRPHPPLHVGRAVPTPPLPSPHVCRRRRQGFP